MNQISEQKGITYRFETFFTSQKEEREKWYMGVFF